MKKTLNTKIADLATTGNASGFIRKLAGVSGQKYRDAHRCRANAAEGDNVDLKTANRHVNEQRAAVEAFRAKYGHLTVGEFLKNENR